LSYHLNECRAKNRPRALQEITDESQLWIELLREECGIVGESIEELQRETNELVAILVTMSKNTRRAIE
jgi:hypothetical protein